MKERWTGRRPKADEVMAQSGITDIRFVENFENDIHRVLNSGNVQCVCDQIPPAYAGRGLR